jgi:hypothetical protein
MNKSAFLLVSFSVGITKMREFVIYLGRRIHLTAVLNESLRRQVYSFPRGAGKPLFMSEYWCAVHLLKNAL